MFFNSEIGIVFATLALLSAAIVETARMTFIHRGQFFDQDVNNQTVVASNLTIGTLIPQYVLMGGADIFIYITSKCPGDAIRCSNAESGIRCPYSSWFGV